MSKTVVIVGLERPAAEKFAASAKNTDRNVVITVAPRDSEKKTDFEEKKIFSYAEWNRTSPVSAKAAAVQAENTYSSMDEALIVFDTPSYISEFRNFSLNTIARAMDTMYTGFLYMTNELLTRFIQKNGGSAVFLLKNYPSAADYAKTPNARGMVSDEKAGVLVSAARDMFISLAENTAALYSAVDGLDITLIRADAEKDEETAAWLFPFLDAERQNKETSKKAKNIIRWIKPGTKPGKSLFGF